MIPDGADAAPGLVPALLSATLLGAAVALAWPWPGSAPVRPPHHHSGGGRLRGLLAVVGTVFLLALVLHGVALGLSLLVLAAARLAVGLARSGRAAATAERRTDQVLLACESLSADLGAGQPPETALLRAAADWPELEPVATASRLGADVPEALREVATLPGAGHLATVAATWHVAHRSGAGLAAALGAAVEGIRADRGTVRVVASELASARATARLMAVLPFAVLLMGSGLGGDPFGFLLASPVGLCCLGLGLAFTYTGLRWLQAIADGVLRR